MRCTPYVVHTKARKESLAEANLLRQDFQTYLPWYKRVVRQRGTWREIVEPLFPRYLFCTSTPISKQSRPSAPPWRHHPRHLRASPRAGLGRHYRCHPPERGRGTGQHLAPERQYKKGDTVAITAGPFEGLQGIFETSFGAQRVALLLDILGKSARVVLNRSEVEPAETCGLPPGREICGTGRESPAAIRFAR